MKNKIKEVILNTLVVKNITSFDKYTWPKIEKIMLEKAYVSPHVEKILNSSEGINLLTQVIEGTELLKQGKSIIVKLDGVELEVRKTNALVSPIEKSE